MRTAFDDGDEARRWRPIRRRDRRGRDEGCRRCTQTCPPSTTTCSGRVLLST
jgi:hypothetical protein